ncbi:MAG: aspartate carbamoyltransferase [Gammaproteobacteria bacterium]|nr:aspartate carbamoyltransferase [Gammaproteobacteria bacterium]NIR98237.1 aspartate carbamoyltransferase [Gammaproteobacteria bacterium]NIT63908.1 aspartate carbamoyltransferase [Gammaproteobacteria bacterium]NIV20912.1 aspartate carbamoyltransferase [Gammaproteobacteria bacterium]NIY32488.1 aspartate carbamoyltransferase [Gammaproteobacteria bacterium]
MNDLDPLLQEPVQPKDWTIGIERPQKLLDHVEESPEPLVDLANHPVVSARQFDRDKTVQLCRLAALYETTPALIQLPLTGKILISAFYEPSTRTRLSFESAWHRLGGDIMSITDPSSTGIAKGESLRDVAEMFNNYGDLVVLRDSHDRSVYEMLESLRIPIINAGNGVDEHPTQALADLYTIFKWRPDLMEAHMSAARRVRIGIIGVPGRMRTVRSLLLFLGLFSTGIEEVVVICETDDVFSEGQRDELVQAGLKLRVAHTLENDLPQLDVIYINSIAWVGDTYEKLGEHLRLSAASPLKKGAIILHPLARGEELSTDLDNTEHNWYFAQARGAVFIRMALLTTLTQRIGQVMDTPQGQ